MKSCFTLIYTLVLLITTSQSQLDWVGSLSAVTMHSTIIFQASITQIVRATITISQPQNYTVYLYRPGQYYPQKAAYQYYSYTTNATFTSSPLDDTGFWRLQILPKNSSQMFIYKLHLIVGQNQYGRYVDVARNKKIFVSYFEQGTDCSFTLSNIAYGLQRSIFVSLYQGQQKMDFDFVKKIYTNEGMANYIYEVNCRAQKTGYYYLQLWASETAMSLFPRVHLSYKTGNYSCPATAEYQDSNDIFKNCLPMSSEQLTGCMNYDYSLMSCVGCQSDYLLQNGRCYLIKECGLDQYFDQGKCLDIIANCINYEFIGGKCKNCVDGYLLYSGENLQFCYFDTSKQLPQPTTTTPQDTTKVTTTANNSSSTTKYTYPSPTLPTPKTTKIVCDVGSYELNGICVLNPLNCLSFDVNLQMCLNCQKGYTLNEYKYSCIVITTKCSRFQTNIFNKCVPYPQNCIQTNSLGYCINCDSMHELRDGLCYIKKCPPNQYLSLDSTCNNLDPNCLQFDYQLRICTLCKTGFVINKTRGCSQYEYHYQTTTACGFRQYLKNNVCIDVNPLCDSFNTYTGECLSCINSLHLLDKATGKCIPQNDVCQNGYFFSTFSRTCQKVSSYCLTYNKTNGYCLSCNQGLTLLNGACLTLYPCGSGQFRNSAGECKKGYANCEQMNQYNGSCQSCVAGYEMNLGDDKCKALLKNNCANVRPVVMTCLQCNFGYQQYDGILSKCKPIK